MLDLGRDVPVETVVDTVREKGRASGRPFGLMTTTLKSMEETIAALHAAKLDCKIMVGGAVLTPEYARRSARTGTPRTPSAALTLPKSSLGCNAE